MLEPSLYSSASVLRLEGPSRTPHWKRRTRGYQQLSFEAGGLFPSLSLHRYSRNVTHVMVGKHDATLRRAAGEYVHPRNEIDPGLLTSPARVSVRRFIE